MSQDLGGGDSWKEEPVFITNPRYLPLSGQRSLDQKYDGYLAFSVKSLAGKQLCLLQLETENGCEASREISRTRLIKPEARQMIFLPVPKGACLLVLEVWTCSATGPVNFITAMQIPVPDYYSLGTKRYPL